MATVALYPAHHKVTLQNNELFRADNLHHLVDQTLEAPVSYGSTELLTKVTVLASGKYMETDPYLMIESTRHSKEPRTSRGNVAVLPTENNEILIASKNQLLPRALAAVILHNHSSLLKTAHI